MVNFRAENMVLFGRAPWDNRMLGQNCGKRWNEKTKRGYSGFMLLDGLLNLRLGWGYQ